MLGRERDEPMNLSDPVAVSPTHGAGRRSCRAPGWRGSGRRGRGAAQAWAWAAGAGAGAGAGGRRWGWGPRPHTACWGGGLSFHEGLPFSDLPSPSHWPGPCAPPAQVSVLSNIDPRELGFIRLKGAQGIVGSSSTQTLLLFWHSSII